MYENTQEPQKHRKNKILYIFLTLCVGFCAVTAFLFIRVIHQDQQFRKLIGDLSASTSLAYSEGNATAVMNGKERMLSGEDLYEIYTLLTNSRGRQMQKRPDTQPEIRVDYGDGAYLEFWSTKLENATNNRAEGLLVYYRGADGWSCCYDTDRLDIGQVKLLLQKKIDFLPVP